MEMEVKKGVIQRQKCEVIFSNMVEWLVSLIHKRRVYYEDVTSSTFGRTKNIYANSYVFFFVTLCKLTLIM